MLQTGVENRPKNLHEIQVLKLQLFLRIKVVPTFPSPICRHGSETMSCTEHRFKSLLPYLISRFYFRLLLLLLLSLFFVRHTRGAGGKCRRPTRPPHSLDRVEAVSIPAPFFSTPSATNDFPDKKHFPSFPFLFLNFGIICGGKEGGKSGVAACSRN